MRLDIVTRDAHTISRRQISENALKVLYRLSKSGYKAYLVGGGVRDILLGMEPKDFDVVTNATPEEIKKLFRNSRLVGRRFRLAHIVFGRDVIEVATFRGHHNENDDKISKSNAEGRLLRDNVYGEIDEDAERRDFTINALYYDISDYSIHSYGGGIHDIDARVIKLIGDPETRYREDPVRMLRAVRFATKLDMTIEPVTAAPIKELAPLLKDIPAARMYEEVLKLFFAGKAEANYNMMQDFGLFAPLFPQIAALIKEQPSGNTAKMLTAVMASTDLRVSQDKPVTPAFFYAALLWYPLKQRADDIALESGLSHYDAHVAAMGDVMEQQCRTISIPRRFSTPAKDIWQLQLRLERSQGTRAFKLLEHPKFRAAYDLLLLRGEAEAGNIGKIANWWQSFVEADEQQRTDIAKSGNKNGPSRNRNAQQRKRRRPNKPKPAPKPANTQE
ncbi:polynucleotide adenylyltransferase PcnB [Pseudomonadota bacterium]|uniref:polynucleotide adenylyltransferase PcnB n=1 Tax=unclassified Shewanella TaxID=196818 RepID=UPI000CC7034D|nr:MULTISPECIES: polynucleotide adenylyltransferase PcnB [unclassified Shewanella]MDO6618029.1 polynucleotide adenylyltransferase PcnB [Shewanella sp. 6_MG-2023]MDO6679188.1 polynucleotide adenylyltransferase PcnB [Shewanella sp. 4_MG-2023]PMG30719.1 poly(A) polymerase [Shewanella sp. 10N.286.52.C2]PMH97040.1 poly(A) polymerase [Shewanella sp. 10N.286.48.A6]